MDMEPQPGVDVGMFLLRGCCLEAERGDIVSLELDGLRCALSDHFHVHLNAVAGEIRTTSRLLRELADRSQVHFERVPVVLNYLNVVLPCLCRSLRDITDFYEDRTITRELRWRKMYNKMTDEAGGLPLPQRFMLYNHFLNSLIQLLMRSYNFDFNRLEMLRGRILELREMRGIPHPPAPVGPQVPPEMLVASAAAADPSVHWSELIFSLPLTSRTGLKHLKSSRSLGPNMPWGFLKIPDDSRILFRRPFDDDQLSVTVFTNGAAQGAPYLLVRTYHAGQPWFAMQGAHELCVSRDGSALHLRRWSRSERCAKLWAALHFQTWEEMVLFYCTFVSLKARNPLTVQISPAEYRLSGERRLFQAQIIDDGFKHSLIVYEDVLTRGLRLHATVSEGELKSCPVWTAFVTHQAASPIWLERRSKHRVWLKDVQLYVFCQKYHQHHQRRGSSDAFEIYFVSREAPKKFKEVFSPPELVKGESSG